MNNLVVIYQQKDSGRWDACVKGVPHIHVGSARDLCMARTFIRMIADEEIGPSQIVEEQINYYEGI